MAAWLDLSPAAERATLVASASARADVVDLLRQHLALIERRGDDVPEWLIQPALRFVDAAEVVEPAPGPALEDAGVPTAVGTSRLAAPSADPDSAAYLGVVELDGDRVRVTAVLDPGARRLWGTAALRARPILLREFGYPLVGIRLVASHVGQMSLIDGLVDVAQSGANGVFMALARQFRLDLELRSPGSSSGVRREVAAEGSERNAALCLESARAELATGEYPPTAFERALERLTATALAERIRPATHGLGTGDYRYLVSPRETWVALEHLSAVSEKDNLARLLEVDGFSIEEYESIRKRVLTASVEQGICAPRRFWRRIIASGLATDTTDYAERLSAHRANLVAEGDDLEPEQARAAWSAIFDLCRRRGVAVPHETRGALGLGEATSARVRGNPTMSAAGEIGAIAGHEGGDEDLNRLRQLLRQPEQRVRSARDALGGLDGVDEVLAALEHFSPDELLALMPSLAEAGAAAVPGLTKLLRSQTPELRQACAVLLGTARDARGLGPLCTMLFSDAGPAWIDAARALGAFGRQALPQLCSAVREAATLSEEEAMRRLARAMSEVALAEGDPSSVAALESSNDPAIAYSASHALATLDRVRSQAERARGEDRGSEFSLRAHEALSALSTLELELIDEAEAAVLGEADLEFI